MSTGMKCSSSEPCHGGAGRLRVMKRRMIAFSVAAFDLLMWVLPFALLRF